MNKSPRMKILLLIVILLILSIAAYKQWSKVPETKNTTKSSAEITSNPTDKNPQKDIEIIAENLNIPWEIAFLPDGELLVTERTGNLLKINSKAIIPIEGVRHIGEGGLLGLALHPKFTENHLIYLYHTTQSGNNITNVVERYRLENNQVTDKKIILQGIGGAANHDGGRIAFGPDGYLYITTGDAQNEQDSQRTSSLNGKILRIKDDGSIPSDNPFGNAIYSYGHRNPQGLAWDHQGNLWATEHGRSGILSGFDELNKIEKGKNYGWPIIQGEQTKTGMLSPVIQSGATTTWAPSGAAFYNGKIFFSGLRGETLYTYDIANKSLQTYLKGQLGRIRAVVLGPDNNLYITTSNRDGRGTIKAGDDKIIRVNPAYLQ